MEIIYIHGYGSSENSFKYRILKESELLKSSDIKLKCLSWDINSDFNIITEGFINKINKEDEIVIISDSTGNFIANILINKLKDLNVYSKWILISPFIYKKQYSSDFIESSVLNQLIDVDFSTLNDIPKTIIIPGNDEVLEYDMEYINNIKGDIIVVNDSHKLNNFKQYLNLYILKSIFNIVL